jgi:hypothetical protein
MSEDNSIESGIAGCSFLILALIVGAAIVILFAAPLALAGTLAGMFLLNLLPERAQNRIGCLQRKEKAQKSFAVSAGVIVVILILHLVYFLSGGPESSFSDRYDHSIVGLYVRAVQPYYAIAGEWLLQLLIWIKDCIVWICESLYTMMGGKAH